ncbi:MAG: hypothetical protein MUO43_11610 [Desulfobacterales bacterium]|nr:hypothetical protein [Desulfobacterales bacterium]
MSTQLWHKIVFSHSQITTGDEKELMDMFNKIFMKLGAPQNFALFSEIPESGPDLIHYLSPAASKDMGSIIRKYSGTPCEKPENVKLRLLVGYQSVEKDIDKL